MPEIIPNWHPIFVHFTVALLSLAVGFHIICHFLSEGKLKQQFNILARWDLWLGTGFGIITAIAGWFAYNSVAHDAPSHVAMTDHRNWALVTVGLFIILAGWSLWCERAQRLPGRIFLAGLLIGGILLTSTAWRGAENVYRYGLGVMSLPQAETGEDGHDHGAHTEDTTSIEAGEKPVESGEEQTATHGHEHGTHTEDTTSINTGEEPVDSRKELTATHGHDHETHTEDTTLIDTGEEPVDSGEEPTPTHGHDHGAHTEDATSIDTGEEPVDSGEEPTPTHGHNHGGTH